jgi:2-keto-4-pentenoate hydratase
MASHDWEETAASAAAELVRQHREKEQFRALPPPWLIPDTDSAYAVQSVFVSELERIRGTKVCGYKIALTTPAMRRMVGFHDSVSGCLLQDQILASGSTISAADLCHLLIEFEIAFEWRATCRRPVSRGAATASCLMWNAPIPPSKSPMTGMRSIPSLPIRS